MSTAPAGSSLLAAARTRSLTLSPPGRLVAALLALLIAALYAPTAQAACDASYATQPAVTIKLGLFLRGDYESVRIRNAVTLALESIPITAYGASIGTDSISLDTANTVLDGCFRQTSNLDPAFPPNSLFTATNPVSQQVGAENGTANLVAAGVHAIIGPSCDIATAFAVNKSRDLQVPLLGYHSVAKSASSATAYPFFLRMNHFDNDPGRQFFALMQQSGLVQFSILYASDDYHSEQATKLFNLGVAAGFDVSICSAPLDIADPYSAANNATIDRWTTLLKVNAVAIIVILTGPTQAEVAAYKLDQGGFTGPTFVYYLSQHLETSTLIRNDYSYRVFGKGISIAQLPFDTVFEIGNFRERYFNRQFSVAGNGPGYFAKFAYDGVFAVAHAIQDMRAACVPSAQMTNRTVLMQYLRATTWIGASGLVKFPAITGAAVAATANNRVFAQEYRISNIVGVAFKDVGGIQNNAVVLSSPIQYQGGFTTPPVHFTVGLLSTPPSSGLSVTDPVFANYWKVPYVALAAAHYVSEMPAILGGRDSLVIVPSQIKTDDCAMTLRHYQAVREMMTRPAPPVAIIGPMCASVVRALHQPDPANPLDRTFPLRIPLISYGVADDDLQSSTAYPFFARSVLSATAEVEALLSTMYSFGWRRISIVYSNDTAGRELFAGALKQAPYFSMRVDASLPMEASLSNAPDGIVWTEENVIKPILAVNTRVILMLLADTSYYVPFLKAAFRQNIGMPAHYTKALPMQLVAYHTFGEAIPYNAQPTPFADWVAMIAQGTIFAKPNVMTTTANYAAMVESYKSLMALGVANFYNLSVSVPGSFTSIGTLNQYPQVQSALTDPGAFAPYVWDAVVAVAVGIKNLQDSAAAIVLQRSTLVANSANQIAAQQAAIATAAKLCAGNCNATNVAVSVTDVTGVLRTLIPPSISNATAVIGFIRGIDTTFTTTGRTTFVRSADAGNNRPGFERAFVMQFYLGRDMNNAPALGDLYYPCGFSFVDYTKSTPSIAFRLDNIHIPTWTPAVRNELNALGQLGQAMRWPIAFVSGGALVNPTEESIANALPVQACSPGSTGKPVYSPTGATLATAVSATGSICSPCAPVAGVEHYVPIGTDTCSPCTGANGTFCVFGGSVLYSDKIYWRRPNGQDLPPQSGPYATDDEISAVFGYFYIYLLVAAVLSLGFAAVLLTTMGKTRRSVRAFAYYFDIFFRNGQHQVPFGQPIVYKETAIGGFYGFTFTVFALLTAVMIVQLFIATQFSITQTISEGLADMTSTPTLFNFNISFISIDDLANCARLCASANANMTKISGQPIGAFSCTPLAAEATCVAQFTIASAMRNLDPTLKYSVSLNYINTRTHGFFVNASGLVFGGKYVSFNSTYEANATTVFFGTKPTVMGFDVLPFQFNGAESATRTPLAQAGYLAAFGYLFPGDVSNEDAWLRPSDLTAGTAVTVEWTVRNAVQVYNVQVLNGFLVLLSQIGGLLGSNLFRVLSAAMIITEIFWARYLVMHRAKRVDIEDRLTELRKLRNRQLQRVANALAGQSFEVTPEEQKKLDDAADAEEERKMEDDIKKAEEGDRAARKRVDAARLDSLQKKQAMRRRRNAEFFVRVAESTSDADAAIGLDVEMLHKELMARAKRELVMKVALQTIRDDADASQQARQDLICQLLNLVKRHCVLHDTPFPFPWVVPTITDADFEPANKRRLERLVEAQTYAAHFVNFASDEVEDFLANRSAVPLGDAVYRRPIAGDEDGDDGGDVFGGDGRSQASHQYSQASRGTIGSRASQALRATNHLLGAGSGIATTGGAFGGASASVSGSASGGASGSSSANGGRGGISAGVRQTSVTSLLSATSAGSRAPSVTPASAAQTRRR